MSPRARQAPPPVPPAPGAEPPPRPRPAPGSSSSLYNAAGGPLHRRPQPRCPARRCRRGPGLAAPAFRALPPPRGPAWGLRPGRWRARTPTRNDRLPPRPAGSGGGGGGRAPRRLRGGGRKWQPGTTRPPAPPPGSRPSSARRGGGHGRPPGAGRGVIWGPGRGALRSDPPPATCGWGCGVPADLGGAAGVGRVPLGGHTSPRRAGQRAAGGDVVPGSSLPPPRAVGAGAAAAAAVAAVAAAPQCGGGAGAGEDPGPGPRGPENAGMGAAGQGQGRERRGWERPGSPLQQHPPSHTHARGHTHAHAPPLGRCRRVLESFASAQ